MTLARVPPPVTLDLGTLVWFDPVTLAMPQPSWPSALRPSVTLGPVTINLVTLRLVAIGLFTLGL